MTVQSRIGGTPLLRLTRIEAAFSLRAELHAKLEFCNLTGSVKDRAALAMLSEAEKHGLERDAVIVEPTSGNTGIALAALCAAKGYRLILVMPDSFSQERRRLLSAYGAELVLTEGAQGMAGAIRRAEELVRSIPHAFMPAQFENQANASAHERTTGPEVFAATAGKVDIFVAGVGTGGTLAGAGKFLKRVKPSVQLVAVEPAASPVLSKGERGRHRIEGIGAGFFPPLLRETKIDEIVCIEEEEAFSFTRLLPKKEGILCGISSGAALAAAVKVASRQENAGKTVVVLLPDSGDRYLSVEGLF